MNLNENLKIKVKKVMYFRSKKVANIDLPMDKTIKKTFKLFLINKVLNYRQVDILIFYLPINMLIKFTSYYVLHKIILASPPSLNHLHINFKIYRNNRG